MRLGCKQHTTLRRTVHASRWLNGYQRGDLNGPYVQPKTTISICINLHQPPPSIRCSGYAQMFTAEVATAFHSPTPFLQSAIHNPTHTQSVETLQRNSVGAHLLPAALSRRMLLSFMRRFTAIWRAAALSNFSFC
jgi:hypothetical protein